jgi:hypothetical protein
MAWERSFEAKVLKIREKELKYQQLNYTIEVSVLVHGYSLPLFVPTSTGYSHRLFGMLSGAIYLLSNNHAEAET